VLLIALLVFAVLGLSGFGTTSFVLEESDEFCISCHRPPEQTYLDRARQARTGSAPIDLASVHMSTKKQTFNCIACHRGSADLGDRISSVTLGLRDTLIHVTGSADPSIEKRTAARPGLIEHSCVTCHTDTIVTAGFENHFHVKLPATWGEYLATLVDAYTRFFYNYTAAPLLIINAADINIVDNDADAAATLLMFLQSTGHEVREASDAAAGLDQARQWRPEVIACEFALPGSMDGCGFASAVRQDPTLRDTYLIALSGHGMEEDKRRARAAGFDIHVTKPADPASLERLVANAPDRMKSPTRG